MAKCPAHPSGSADQGVGPIRVFKHGVSVDFCSGLGTIKYNFTLHTRETVECGTRCSWCYRNEPWERQLPLSLVMPVCPEPTWWKERADSFLKVVLGPVWVHRGALSHTSIYTQNHKCKLELCGVVMIIMDIFVQARLRPVFPTHPGQVAEQRQWESEKDSSSSGLFAQPQWFNVTEFVKHASNCYTYTVL